MSSCRHATAQLTSYLCISGFFESSVRAFAPAAASDPANDIMRDVAAEGGATKVEARKEGDASETAEQPSYGSVAFSAAASAATTATTVGINATQSVTAAGGWLAKRLSREFVVFEILVLCCAYCDDCAVGLQSIVKPVAKTDAAAEGEPAAAQQDGETKPAVAAEFSTFPSEGSAATAAPPAAESEPAAAAPVEVTTSVSGDAAEDSASSETAPAASGEGESSAPTSPAITRPVIKSKKDKKTEN